MRGGSLLAAALLALAAHGAQGQGGATVPGFPYAFGTDFEPFPAYEASPVEVRVVVRNPRDEPGPPFRARLVLDGVEVDAREHAGLGPGEAAAFAGRLERATLESSYDFEAFVEGYERVALGGGVPVHATTIPILEMGDVRAEPASPAPGDSVVFAATVENRGWVDADAVTVQWTRDGSPWGEPERFPLRSNETREVRTPAWRIPIGAVRIAATATAPEVRAPYLPAASRLDVRAESAPAVAGPGPTCTSRRPSTARRRARCA